MVAAVAAARVCVDLEEAAAEQAAVTGEGVAGSSTIPEAVGGLQLGEWSAAAVDTQERRRACNDEANKSQVVHLHAAALTRLRRRRCCLRAP